MEEIAPLHKIIIACSRRRHDQDKTVLSCLCRRCEHNWRQDKTHRNWAETRQICLVSGVYTIGDKTRQFCLVRVGGVNELLKGTRAADSDCAIRTCTSIVSCLQYNYFDLQLRELAYADYSDLVNLIKQESN